MKLKQVKEAALQYAKDNDEKVYKELTKVDYVKQGKANRRKGAAFELKVRKYLIEKGWIVDKWTNNIKEDKCIQAKSNRFNTRGTGFPDFIAYRGWYQHTPRKENNYEVKFIECKVAKYLDKEEKAKAQWYLKNNYCSCFYVAFLNKEKKIEFQKIEVKE